VASAAFVGFFVDSAFPPGGDGHLVTTDQRGGSARVVLTESTPNAFLRDPRWRPNADDILYVRASYDASNRHLTNSLLVTDASGRTPRAFVTARELTMLAAWTPSGTEIVYVTAEGVAGSVFLLAADGTNERRIQDFGGVPEAQVTWLDLAVLSL
jgi:hypothetical protein